MAALGCAELVCVSLMSGDDKFSGWQRPRKLGALMDARLLWRFPDSPPRRSDVGHVYVGRLSSRAGRTRKHCQLAMNDGKVDPMLLEVVVATTLSA